jgi:lipopolysaccharide transport system ATP-binding protein
VAINVDPDVLLIDEVLAVGDEAFTHKCLDKFAEFRRRGKTVLLVTHSLNLVERFCDEALWLDHGRSRALGDPRRVVSTYITDVEKQEERHMASADARSKASVESGSGTLAESARIPNPESRIPTEAASVAKDETAPPPPDMFQATEGRWGSREGEITSVELVGEDHQPAHVFFSGERVEIRLGLHANQALADFVVGIGIFNVDGVCAFGTNTNIEELKGERLEGDGTVSFHVDGLDLVAGTYKLDVALHKLDGFPYDYHRLLYSFRVKSRTQDAGIYRPRHAWSFGGGVSFKERVGA